jgi:hypothetical protein
MFVRLQFHIKGACNEINLSSGNRALMLLGLFSEKV